MAYDAATRTVVLFTGAALIGGGETWTWDGSAWTEQAPAVPTRASGSARRWPTTLPLAPWCCSAGHTHGGGFLGDTWTWG